MPIGGGLGMLYGGGGGMFMLGGGALKALLYWGGGGCCHLLWSFATGGGDGVEVGGSGLFISLSISPPKFNSGIVAAVARENIMKEMRDNMLKNYLRIISCRSESSFNC